MNIAIKSRLYLSLFFCYNDIGDNMKKMLPIIFVLGAFGLIIQFFVQSFIKYHEVDYSIITSDNEYMINEKLNVKDGKNVYSFKVVDDKTKETFQFDFSHNYNKQDNIIRDIKFYQYEDLVCLFPIYKKKLSKDIVCNYKGIQTSYSYLKQIGNTGVEKFISSLKKDDYMADTWKKDVKPSEEYGYKIYKENIPDNIVFTMWFYHGFYRISKDKIEEKNYLNDDCYENNRSYLIDNFLVSINTDDYGTNAYMDFYIFDIVNGGKKKMDFDEQLSKNMYFNGAYKGKLYYTDLDKKKQYSIDPEYEVLKEVGNVDIGFKKVEGKALVTVEAKDFLDEKVYFEKQVKNTKLEELYGATEIKKDNNIYYFWTDSGDFYKVNIMDIKKPILLFNFDDISEWIVKDGNVMIVSKDMMYFYNDDLGLLPILENNELNYNYKNICNFAIAKK